MRTPRNVGEAKRCRGLPQGPGIIFDGSAGLFNVLAHVLVVSIFSSGWKHWTTAGKAPHRKKESGDKGNIIKGLQLLFSTK
jgi:hypothetical protein